MANTKYKVLKGIDYPPNKRAEIGATVSDLPKESIPWLLASGVIEVAKTKDSAFVETSQKAEAIVENEIGEDSVV